MINPFGTRTATCEVERSHRRTNRRTYVTEIALVFGVIYLAVILLDRLEVQGLWFDLLLSAVFVFLIGRALAARNHDLGRTDEWVLIPLAGFTIGWVVHFFWHDAPVIVSVLGYTVSAVALLVPAFIRGDTDVNRYGSCPEESIEPRVIANVG